MGVNISSQTTTNVIKDFTKTIQSSSTNILNSSTGKCTSGGTSIAYFGYRPGGGTCYFKAGPGSNITDKQTVTSKCTFKATNFISVQNHFKDTLKDTVKNFIQQQQKSEVGWFAVAFGLNIQNATNAEEVSSLVEQHIKNNINNICTNVATGFANNQTVVCGEIDGDFNISNKASATAITSCGVSIVLDAFEQNDTLKQLWSQTDSKESQKLTGVGGILKWIIIAVMIIVIVVVIAFVVIGYKFLEGGGQGLEGLANLGGSGGGGKMGEMEELAML